MFDDEFDEDIVAAESVDDDGWDGDLLPLLPKLPSLHLPLPFQSVIRFFRQASIRARALHQAIKWGRDAGASVPEILKTAERFAKFIDPDAGYDDD